MKINIQNLTDGLHEISEQVEPLFVSKELQRFYPEICQVDVTLDKFGKDYRVDVHLTTTAHYICHRCLSPYTAKFDVRQRQLYQIGAVPGGGDADIVELSTNAIEIDISPLMKEMIILNHPIKMLCKEDCKGICPNCGADWNHEVCRCGEEVADPRWEQLRKLIK